MKHLKLYEAKGHTRPGSLLPAPGTKIKMVADTTDPATVKHLKNIWNSWTEEFRAIVLEKMGHSAKYAAMDFDHLTGEIQSKIVTSTHSLT